MSEPSPQIQASRDHHYIPAFYLKRWGSSSGKLFTHSRPRGALVIRECSPRATGYERDLYALHNLPFPTRSVLEDVLMNEIDQQASDALDCIELDEANDLSKELRISWARFLLSLYHRHPETFSGLRARWSKQYNEKLIQVRLQTGLLSNRADDHYLRVDQGFGMLFSRVLSSERVISHIAGMSWHVLVSPDGHNRFLTSDRPLMRTNGIGNTSSHITLPIRPDRIFIATNSPETFKRLRDRPSKLTVALTNDFICRAARRYVYSGDQSQTRFIDNRLTKT